jgi:hypothetical protein
MQRALDQLFKDAVNRRPKRLSFDTTYSHGNIYDWLKTILTDWTIIIPGSSCSAEHTTAERKLCFQGRYP